MGWDDAARPGPWDPAPAAEGQIDPPDLLPDAPGLAEAAGDAGESTSDEGERLSSP